MRLSVAHNTVYLSSLARAIFFFNSITAFKKLRSEFVGNIPEDKRIILDRHGMKTDFKPNCRDAQSQKPIY